MKGGWMWGADLQVIPSLHVVDDSLVASKLTQSGSGVPAALDVGVAFPFDVELTIGPGVTRNCWLSFDLPSRHKIAKIVSS